MGLTYSLAKFSLAPTLHSYQIQDGGLILERQKYAYRAGLWEGQETKSKFVPSLPTLVAVWSQFLPASLKELEKSFASLTNLKK